MFYLIYSEAPLVRCRGEAEGLDRRNGLHESRQLRVESMGVSNYKSHRREDKG